MRSLGTADEADIVPEAGPDNLPDPGGLKKENGVEEAIERADSQMEMEEELGRNFGCHTGGTDLDNPQESRTGCRIQPARLPHHSS